MIAFLIFSISVGLEKQSCTEPSYYQFVVYINKYTIR